VSAAVKAAECDGAQRIFALTYHPRLFEHQGFQRVSKDLFPEKVWHDCAKCPKRDRCDEIALLKKMN
ncbi:MAG: GNAT family N-acetyltransferase, partial [Candidatus Pacebacteria bacterium]|nr:GNAT family N-acetyltransferase [Candidatus Paceibacterota bacterium]